MKWLLVVLLLPNLALSQKKKSVGLEMYFNEKKIGNATGFIISYKKKTYFATNYHVLTNRQSFDTSIFAGAAFSPNRIKVYFYDANNKKIPKDYLLLDNKNSRLFYVWPPRKNITRTIDISILPIALPSDANINIINFGNLDTTWSVRPNSTLEMYGFPGVLNPDKINPDTIILKSTIDRNYTYRDFMIIATTSKHTGGASGSPVYLKNSKNPIFVGVLNGIAPNAKYKDSRTIITSNYILQLLNMYVK
jgi:hypothetical protein